MGTTVQSDKMLKHKSCMTLHLCNLSPGMLELQNIHIAQQLNGEANSLSVLGSFYFASGIWLLLNLTRGLPMLKLRTLDLMLYLSTPSYSILRMKCSRSDPINRSVYSDSSAPCFNAGTNQVASTCPAEAYSSLSSQYSAMLFLLPCMFVLTW